MTVAGQEISLKAMLMMAAAFVLTLGLTFANASIAFGDEDDDNGVDEDNGEDMDDNGDDDNGYEDDDYDDDNGVDEDNGYEDDDHDDNGYEDEDHEEGDELPATASAYPMGLLIGMMAAGAGAFMITKRRQTA
ncbi:LPXTG-motif cell wall-anchored protein [Salsuginibacillus halophilus]|uniref:LPXTG-motif cell wall-anchored protein n=1 Tax=Salsuginibacillus halophilus TaxID=517424 RepID=A0A2P8HFV0_9BACI|nr:LPXTG cell wall anchor domain-containing protein [Salsuginibacillus halophilus]PSL45102.1 LPXTG-motif cell wall-anchored protein [Salsuginibacillus halophilus]